MHETGRQDSTVISFQAGVAAQGGARARTLVDQSRHITLEFLPSLLQRMLDNADDTLFELADKADNNLQQNSFFDAMRELRKERQTIEEVFALQLREAFTGFFTAPKRTQPNSIDNEIDFDTMGLVDDTELEESLAVNGMATKAKSRYPRELYSIEHRFDAIVSEFSVDIDHVPVGPKLICRAFDESAKGLDVETKIKLIIYKLFDKFVLSHLKPLFDEINALFIAAGVLPSLKMTVKKQPESGRPVLGAPQDTSWLEDDSVTPTQQSLDAGAGLNREQTDNSALVTLQQLLSSQLPKNVSQSGAEHEHLGGAEIVQALSNLQFKNVDMNPAVTVEQLKASLSDEVSTLKDAGSFTSFDNDVIDIVGMLFDFILDDENLPSMAKALLARLQIPMLKVAMLDKDFFSSKQHAARQLLNRMAKTTVGLSEGVNSDNCPLIGKIDEIVTRVLEEFKDDTDIFAEFLEEFETYFEQEAAREKAAQEVDLERLKKREKQTLTNAWVTDIIASRIKDRELPKPVYELIEGPWKEVMINTYLNEGENSTHWKENMRFMDVLMWSIEPKDDCVDKKRLGNVIQQLVDTLRDELKNVYFPPAKLDEILRNLEAFHMASLRGDQTKNPVANVRVKAAPAQPPGDTPESSEEIARELDAMRDSLAELEDFDVLLGDVLGDINPDKTVSPHDQVDADSADDVEEIVLSSTGLKNKTTPEIDDDYWQMVLGLSTGQWISLTDNSGRMQRIKLAWKSDVVGECTFINWKFKIAADFTFNQLAARFRNGKAALIENLPLFERAFDSVMNRLQKSTPQQA